MSALVFSNLDERLTFEESGKAVERKSLSYLEVLSGQHADSLTKRMDGALQHRRQRYEQPECKHNSREGTDQWSLSEIQCNNLMASCAVESGVSGGWYRPETKQRYIIKSVI
ncbi:homeobox protein Mohawk-like [Clarias magur]|uniref:Homeobox protein Mohawk-like n=1 Tax=Clarias magur TaxID=1594786 RepID=A0A8J4U2S1_CLAMG|nr:homeobox protein Mohawk-like [Clarias magur]